MTLNPYIGHPSQLCGVEEVRLVGGKGDGMRLFQVHNAAGLAFTVSADRCADLSRVSFQGDNMGYFAPCGYVAPEYFVEPGANFLKSFNAGFMTTCGIANVGGGVDENGMTRPFHGTIGNTPCERIWWTEDDDTICIHAEVNDSQMFGRKLMLRREISCPKNESSLTIRDTVENQGDVESPVMLLYHMNMGYPLLSEDAEVEIDSESLTPCSDVAAQDQENWNRMHAPTKQMDEKCYLHKFGKNAGRASIYNPKINKGLEITFDSSVLRYMLQWKMLGYRDYALGLEPSNRPNSGQDALRESGELDILQPGETRTYEINVRFFNR